MTPGALQVIHISVAWSGIWTQASVSPEMEGFKVYKAPVQDLNPGHQQHNQQFSPLRCSYPLTTTAKV